MHVFEYWESWKQLLTPQIVLLLTRVHEEKGKQKALLLRDEKALRFMKEEARVLSIRYSCDLEGVFVQEERFKPLVTDKAHPNGEAELLLAGYRDAIKYVNDSYAYATTSATSVGHISPVFSCTGEDDFACLRFRMSMIR